MPVGVGVGVPESVSVPPSDESGVVDEHATKRVADDAKNATSGKNER